MLNYAPPEKLSRQARLELSARYQKNWGLLRPIPRRLAGRKLTKEGALCALLLQCLEEFFE